MAVHVQSVDHTPRSPSRVRIASEVATLMLAAATYFGVRIVVEGTSEPGDRNADRILRFEEWLGVDIEKTMQDLALESEFLRELGNFSYVWLHWPLLIVAIAFVFFRDEHRYLQLRNALFASGAVGLVLFWLYPVSPPRFMPGFIGTVSPEARRHFLDIPVSWSNQYAAFPSFHTGWTLIACLAVAATLQNRAARAVVLAPAVLVAISVVTTGNHYVADATAGALIAAGFYAWFGRRADSAAHERAENEPLI